MNASRAAAALVLAVVTADRAVSASSGAAVWHAAGLVREDRAVRRLVLVLLLVLAALPATAGAAAPLRFGPAVHHDARDVAASPLDLREVTFGQRDAQLVLRVRTAGRWSPGDLGGATGRRLCVAIRPGASRAVRTRICVAARAGRPALRVASYAADGRQVADRSLPALVARTDRRTVDAVVSRLAAGLPLGPFSWAAESAWVDDPGGRCTGEAPCADAFPDAGAVPDALALLAQPACFGAASRAPRRRCVNPALRTAVVPTPANALLMPNAYCRLTRAQALVSPCEFGVPRARAKGVIAAVGDSHTEHWRGALEVVAQAKGWHGLSITRASCPLTRAEPVSPRTAFEQRQCRRWNDETLRWLRRHPEVHTLFVSDHATVRLRKDAVWGYQEAWRRVPRSVTRIVVLRDTTDVSYRQAGCVARHRRAGQPAGVACAEPRARNLHPDPQAAAAYRLGSRRVQVVDLTRFLCDAQRCFAVVGGALVHKDNNHMTAVFATTLGPYLLRAYDALPRR